MSKTAREIMTGQAECIGENESVGTAAEKMARLDVGSLPICGEDDRLKGTRNPPTRSCTIRGQQSRTTSARTVTPTMSAAARPTRIRLARCSYR